MEGCDTVKQKKKKGRDTEKENSVTKCMEWFTLENQIHWQKNFEILCKKD